MTLMDEQIPVLSVTALNSTAREIIEGNFPLLRVEGEISNFSAPGSGHWYFSLKDSSAQVRCAMFRQRNTYSRMQPRNGLQVLVLAQPTLYEGRGEFQLVVEQIQESGEGDLQARFVALKEKLAAEGLFEARHKRPLPIWPQRVAVITSATGAALQDIRATLARRWPLLTVLVYPVLVQGEQASAQIVEALHKASTRRSEEVIILARGGGSAEDLWCFNEEVVARAIRASTLPVVTGIGHEIDFTIADFASDLRAATPTAAAEAVSPDRSEWLPRVQGLSGQLTRQMQRKLQDEAQRLDFLRMRLRHPGEGLDLAQQRLAAARQNLARAMLMREQFWTRQFAYLEERRRRQDPIQHLQALQKQLEASRSRLRQMMLEHLQRNQLRLQQSTAALGFLDPLAVLQRGFAVLRDASGKVLFSSADSRSGDILEATLARGTLHCQVLEADATGD
ncbi:exodeoxyribonuclease VII large subunit [Acidithiobacillus montserratensis]|uniref:Exodeoxyribonuclease VII large subunit n=1 Tax=Acidithiobacillus montserratensis TaxID=2729135 RepID=A0ACD5HKN9_9PROT|nr:exodeoxyribonuclease VII large subunit [Acidithiobacillus montserratensis]MBN2679591.1 exodeoxyribonuclease VII large subunit [Acidithiobacillaceae bacterium]MBU2749302.1 exodeoxyribonuclease VII large subunit [Acidithiobacillus montserratensis]